MAEWVVMAAGSRSVPLGSQVRILPLSTWLSKFFLTVSKIHEVYIVGRVLGSPPELSSVKAVWPSGQGGGFKLRSVRSQVRILPLSMPAGKRASDRESKTGATAAVLSGGPTDGR